MSDQPNTNQEPAQPTPPAQTQQGNPAFPQTVIVDHGTKPTVATAPQDDTPPQDDGRDVDAEIQKLRKEAAKWRTQLRDTEKQLKAAAPALEELNQLRDKQKTDEEKLREQITKLQTQAEAAQQAADLAQKQVKLTGLASKVGVDPDVVALLDINKLDLEDETAVLETLTKLKTAPAPVGGSASNPAGQQEGTETYDDKLRTLFGKGQDNRYKIFGG